MATAFQTEAFQFNAFQIDAEGGAVNPVGLTNWALAANGGVATASSVNTGGLAGAYTTNHANDGFRTGKNWAKNLTDAGWNDATLNVWGDWLQIDFVGAKTVGIINVITLRDNYAAGIEPTLADTFTMYGIIDFDVQYWDGTAFVNVPGGSVTGNTKVWCQFIFSPVTTAKIRVTVNDGKASFSRIVELEAWGSEAIWSGVSRGRNLAGISRGRM